MELEAAAPLGIMADSHGNNELLLATLDCLKSLGAGELFHLGDLCDSLSSTLLVRQAFEIIAEHRISCVRGNNECVILHNAKSSRQEDDRSVVIPLLSGLPYVIRRGGLWFTHSVPLGYPAATKRPVSEFLSRLSDPREFPFSLLFRGHSHRPSILGIHGQSVQELAARPDEDIHLDRSVRYIVTAGAVETGSCLLYKPAEHAVRFITAAWLRA